jgi:hypothetical protein
MPGAARKKKEGLSRTEVSYAPDVRLYLLRRAARVGKILIAVCHIKEVDLKVWPEAPSLSRTSGAIHSKSARAATIN